MKKILTVICLVLGLASLAACDKGEAAKLSGLEVSGQKTEYVVGESFDASNIVVTAVYDNETSSVVTESAEVNGPADLSVAGTYAVFVSYEGFTTAYQINVVAPAEPEPASYANVGAAVEAAVANASKVKAGNAVVDYAGYLTEYAYQFGANSTVVTSNQDGYESSNYFELLEDESAFGVSVAENFWTGELEVSSYYGALPLHLQGVDFASVVSYNYDVYGVEQLLQVLYNLQDEKVYNYQENIEVCGVCSEQVAFNFSFDVYMGYYQQVEVKFVMDLYNEVASELVINMKGYYDENVSYDEENDAYTVLTDVADFTRKVAASQEVGERTFVNEYSSDALCYSAFDLKDAEGNEANNGQYSIQIGDELSFTVENATPDTASEAVDFFECTVLDAEGYETYAAYCNMWEGVLTFNTSTAGNYTVIVKTAKVEKSFSVEVAAPALSSFEAGYYDSNAWAIVASETATVYVGSQLEVGVVVNTGANKAATASLAEATEDAVVEEGESNFVFTAYVPGEYTVNFVSSEDATFTSSITITVVEAPSPADILNGTYSMYGYMLGEVTYVITPSYPGAIAGTCVISATDMNTYEPVTYNCTYSFAAGQVAVIDNATGVECVYGLAINASDYSLLCTYNGFEQYPALEKVEESGDGETGEEGEPTTTPVVGENYVTASYFGNPVTFTAEEAGTYTFTVDASEAEMGYDYGYYTTLEVTLEAGQSVEIVMLTPMGGAQTDVVVLTITQA